MDDDEDLHKITNWCIQRFRVDTLCFIVICLLKLVLPIFGNESEPLLSYDLLYESGLEAYHEEKWFQCVAFLDKAVADYKQYKQTLTDCRIKCKRKIKPIYSKNEHSSFDLQKLELYEWTIFESHCVQKCKQKLSGDRFLTEVDPLIDEDFVNRKPYDYLQFCYFKLGKVTEAASSAYTYYLANPKHEETINNIHFYRGEDGVKDVDIIDYERKPYQEFYIKGSAAHDDESWSDVIQYFEKAITEYYAEEERCRSSCDGMFDHGNQPENSQFSSITDLYIKLVTCQYECESKLDHLYVERVPDFVPEHYNYLQYAYNKIGEYDKAVEALATFLIFKPDDVEMVGNKFFYLKKMGYHEGHFTPRRDAVEYYKRREMMKKMLKYADELYSGIYRDDDTNMEMEVDNSESSPPGVLSSPETADGGHYMKGYERLGVKLIAQKDELKGSRVVADGFYRDEQGQELTLLANKKDPDDRGIRVMKISDALQIVQEDHEFDIALRLFLRAAEVTRHFSLKYFNKTALFVKEARLVCREPESRSASEDGVCIEQEDGHCKNDDEVEDEETIDDFIALGFLQDKVEDGQTYFLDRRGNKQTSINQKCGRFVIFQASDRHGVEPSASQRCVLHVQLTQEREKDDPSHRKAMEFLHNLDQSLHNASLAMNNTEYLKLLQDQGISITMSGKDLKGEERFVADGLANEEQCTTLIELAKEGAVGGDGYKHNKSPHTFYETFSGVSIGRAAQSGEVSDGYDKAKEQVGGPISPHTIHETFEGLTVGRAAKLAVIEAIQKSSVKLFLDLSEKGRLLVEKYFNLTRPLYFDFTHLVCRTAIEGGPEEREGDLSHPVHSDNCNIKPDGTCIREPPAYIQRDYSAVLYLNDNFDGGKFFFAHPNKTAQVTLKPKCGRLVGFNAGEYHGVMPIMKGQRCAIAMWYTFDPSHKELAHVQARKMLQNLSERLQKTGVEARDEL